MRNDSIERSQLLHWITTISFAMEDAALYLDTHPENENALKYYFNYAALRKQALEDYATCFSPLTKETASSDQAWKWVAEPWPWEGGVC